MPAFHLHPVASPRHSRPLMSLKRKIAGGILVWVGFLLSPLSWWNDAFVNLPLALAFGWIVGALSPANGRDRAFQIAVVVGYWLTNMLGFVLMHKGVRWLRSPTERAEAGRELWRDFWISLGYTALIIALIKFGVLKPFESYFPQP